MASSRATKSGVVSTAEVFVERGIQPKKTPDSWRLVANAAKSGSIPMVDFLLLHNVGHKQQSPEGWTALHFASAAGHTAYGGETAESETVVEGSDEEVERDCTAFGDFRPAHHDRHDVDLP